jgi:dienelactone hydrolase
MKTTFTAAAVLGLTLAVPARAEIKTEEIEYKQGDTVLKGFLAFDDAARGKRPGVLVVHEWWGHNQHARNQATRLAEAGYVGFALDMYGKDKVATHPDDAKAFMEEATKDPKLVAARFDAALDVLKKRPEVDARKIAALGYCFGGTVSLGMARAGADLAAVVTFHAGLKPPGEPAQRGKVKARILVNTGGQDPMVPKEQVAEFKAEMRKAGAKAEVRTYPAARHSFTNPDAAKAGMAALAYDADADQKSWEATRGFLKRAFRK